MDCCLFISFFVVSLCLVLKQVVSDADKDEEYWQMAKAATRAEFPFIIWKENLKEAWAGLGCRV